MDKRKILMENNELILKQNPTLKDFQNYIKKAKSMRHFNQTDVFYECCLLTEEVGELVSAVRKNNKKGSVGSGSIVQNLSEELADVFMYVLSIANMHQIDLEEAFRQKEQINKTRIWTKG